VAREFVGDDGLQLTAPVSEAQRSVLDLTNAVAGETPPAHVPAWIREHMAHAPVIQVVSDAHCDPILASPLEVFRRVPIDPDMPTLDDQDDDNDDDESNSLPAPAEHAHCAHVDDEPTTAIHGPDGLPAFERASDCVAPRRRMCPHRREAMARRQGYDPDRTYLDVDFTGTPGYRNGFNQFAKDRGAQFDWEHRLFYIPMNICPMAALWVVPAISYTLHLSIEIVKYQRDQGITPSHCARLMIIMDSFVPNAFSRVRVVVGPGARDRVVRNRRTMSSVIIGMLTLMT
jgi:hypothetical protein